MFLQQAIIYLGAAVLCVPLIKRLGLSAVLGYLLAGILIGPFGLGLVGEERTELMHFAEMGVVMMLFIIGLELEPAQFWAMRRSILGLGMSQMSLTTLLLGGLFLSFGWSWSVALTVALAFSMSSTAIVLQTLKERGNARSTMGQSAFSVLLFQDIAVIPILALLPLLTAGQVPLSAEQRLHTQIEDLPSWLQAIVVVGAGGSIFFLGRYLIVPMLRAVARTRMHELFTAASLLLVLAISYLMQIIGLSPALGAFLAGVVLANSEFRHELESDLSPFKGLLLGLFFIGVGAALDFNLVLEAPDFILITSVLVMLIKGISLFVIGRFFRLSNEQNLPFALAMSQVGEFAFVLISFAQQIDLLPQQLANQLMSVTAISMFATPFLLLANDRLIDPYFGVKQNPDPRPSDVVEEQHPVIIAGFGHFGSTIGRLLRANGIEATILDHDSDRVELLRKMGFKVYYGDATRLEILEAAGASKARVFIAAIDSPETNARIIELLRKHFPHLHIFARARNRMDAYDLIEHDVKHIYRETLYTAVNLAEDVLVAMGFRRYTAHRQAQRFIRYDERSLRKLAAARREARDYVLTVKEEIEMQERLLQDDLMANLTASDHAWDSEPMRSGKLI
ncbi:MAG: monovalent cation:proton antiporter-2 (CPA2) family protein [Saprospiraceae bacterium]|nr:monovalent cation:proton antiporter-2 (CPA2) family protein [Saprospiraceae bacterium]MDW8482882.1 monovalent cation:proton antiporter-2 (CPA2) family protein [Saprospiraceae bacterium]